MTPQLQPIESTTATLTKTFLEEGVYLRNWSPKTVSTYRGALRSLPSSISKASLSEMVVAMRQRGLTAGGINVRLRSINSFLTWMHEGEQTSERLRVKLLKAERKVITTLSDQDVREGPNSEAAHTAKPTLRAQREAAAEANRQKRAQGVSAILTPHARPTARPRHSVQSGPSINIGIAWTKSADSIEVRGSTEVIEAEKVMKPRTQRTTNPRLPASASLGPKPRSGPGWGGGGVPAINGILKSVYCGGTGPVGVRR